MAKIMPAMMRYFVAAILITLACSFDVAVSVGSAHASTVVSSLTSVTMDVCVAKQRFPFGDKDLLGLTSHLGGGDSILRIGGSDQNSFHYDVNSTKTETYSAKTGEQCCKDEGSCHGCADDCTMPAPYWKSMTDFANATGHKFVFGLIPKVDEAKSLITHSAKQQLPVFAYTFGNEEDTPEVIAGYPVLQKLLSSTFAAGKAPRLAGPDVALQRHDLIDIALAGGDKTITKKLAWVEKFTAAVGSYLDVVSWHTYDYETPSVGMSDHQDLKVNPEMARLWSTKYLDFALRLSGNVTSIAKRAAPRAAVWLTESNSVCHQVSGLQV
jgi:hypothetical protein